MSLAVAFQTQADIRCELFDQLRRLTHKSHILLIVMNEQNQKKFYQELTCFQENINYLVEFLLQKNMDRNYINQFASHTASIFKDIISAYTLGDLFLLCNLINLTLRHHIEEILIVLNKISAS